MPLSHAVIVTSEYSRGAKALRDALERAGFSVSRSTLEQTAVNNRAGEELLIDRCLAPYDLPVVDWAGTWWNRPDRVWTAGSKAHTALIAQQRDLRHPRTVIFEPLRFGSLHPESEYVSAIERAEATLDLLGGKVVVKPDRGMQGAGLYLIQSAPDLLLATSELSFGVAQEFIPQAATTLRVLATQREVIAAFARKAAEGDWRGNVAAGASIYPVHLTDTSDTARLATATVRAFGLDMAGIDIVDTPNGPLMLEPNPSFGVTGLLTLFPDALDRLIDSLRTVGCSCGETRPHDAWACS